MSNLIYIAVFWPMVGAIVSYIIGRYSKDGRNLFADAVVVTEFLLMLYIAVALQGTDVIAPGIAGMGLHFKIDGFRGIYTVVAALMWMMTIIFSKEYFGHYRNRNRYYLFQLVTLGATIGVFLSANLYTTFIFFEVMSFTSYVWVAQDERKVSMRAAETYLAVAVIGGMVLLMGLFLLYNAIGTLEMGELLEGAKAYAAVHGRTRLFVAGGCLLFGFGAKAGAFPLHIWLPKAHPVAPAPASALLSGILTKAGVFGILVISCYMFYGDRDWGGLILILGSITMFTGALLAVFSTDLKRTLACSSMSQIGFIMVGVAMQCFLGEENALAVYGSFLHMMNHSLIKLVLFMVAGVIYMNIHKLDLNEIRGFGRNKPLLNFSFLMGALGIGGIPFWNGYISKTLLHEGIVEYRELVHEELLEKMVSSQFNFAESGLGAALSHAGALTFFEWVFLVSGGLTVAYMTKLYIAIFVEKNRNPELQAKFDGLKGRYMNRQSTFAIVGSAVILPVLGFLPNRTMARLAMAAGEFMNLEHAGHIPHFFAWECLKGGLISIAIGVLVYVVVIRNVFMKKQLTADIPETDASAQKLNGETERNNIQALINPEKDYLDLWPKWLDLENLIYRPIVQRILPFCGTFVARVGDSLLDSIVVLLRKTVYKDCKRIYHTGRPPKLDSVLGAILDKGAVLLKNSEDSMRYRMRLRSRALKARENRDIILSSLSYGLIIAGIGMIFVLIFLMV